MIMMHYFGITKVLFILALSWLVSVEGDEDCPTVEVKHPFYVQGDVECNNLGTLEFYVYEDCPRRKPIFTVSEDLSIDDCYGHIFPMDHSFGFAMVGDAENSGTRSVICRDFLVNTIDSSITYHALFTFVDVNEFLPNPADGLGITESIKVDENTLGNIFQFNYTDPDYGETGTLTCIYKFEGDAAETFEIKTLGPKNDVMMFSLVAKKNLDFETNSFFSLQAKFQSEDSRGNSSSLSQSFLIFVQDLGDNPPFFTKIVPFASIPEGDRGTFVFQVEAQDRDVIINNKIFYSIISGNVDGYFTINNSSGEVFTAKDIDREALQSTFFPLEIQAMEVLDDEGTPAPDQNTTSQVTNVNIEDINDNIPTFDSDSYVATMEEFDETNPTSSKTLDVIITVTDMDEGPSGEYKLTTNNPDVSLNPTHGSGETSFGVTVKESENFDYETHAKDPNIVIEITATERVLGTHVSTVNLIITLIDVNDNAPKFEKSEYSANVKESDSPGTFVIAVSATDDDASPEFNDNFLRYSLSGCDELTIDEITGDIKLSESADLDYEEEKVIACKVLVKDMNGTSVNSLRSEVPLTVNIIDVNDESPAFVNFENNVNVVEGAKKDSEVTTVEVVDPDTSASLAVSLEYANNPGPEVESWFDLMSSEDSVDSHYLGRIVIKNSPDREKASEVVMKITAMDVGAQIGDQLIIKTLTVVIKDVNDEPPQFVDDYSNLNYDENTPKDTVVLIVEAKDPDLADELAYSLVDDLNYLKIDERSGEVSVKNEVDREKVPNFEVTVYVKDLVNHTEYVQISVTVNDLNDNAPQLNDNICSSFYSVIENATNGTLLATVEAYDDDEGIHAEIIYVLKNYNMIGYEYQYAPFDIDRNTGEITVDLSADRVLDREEYSKWQLIIDAFDQCDETDPVCRVHNDECLMMVSVEDVNDNPPGNYKLNSGTTIITNEFLTKGESIAGLKISAHDPDKPNTENSEITFETVSMWHRDGSSTELLFTALDHMRVNLNGIHEYYCTLEATTNLTGRRGEYVIEIMGKDSGEPVLLSRALFPVIIEDANDMIPEFSYSKCLQESNQTITMTEKTKLNVPLNCSSGDIEGKPAYISVHDGDMPFIPNSEVELSISYEDSVAIDGGADNQLEAFYVYDVNSRDGLFGIAISEVIDIERGSRYNLSLVAHDHGDVPQTSFSWIYIIVKDVSEFPPTFCEKAPCKKMLYIKENTNEITRFPKAEDKDNGKGGDDINDIIYYSVIRYDVDAFVIPRNTVPEIMPRIPLDREVRDTFEMEIMASNSPTVGIEDTNQVIKISVVVLDENDEYPVFNDVIYGEFLDTGNKGDQVAILAFRDKDLNDTITYSFGSPFRWNEGQNYTDPFRIEKIDDRTSKIVLNMDPEGKFGYCSFTVDAQDKASHNASALAQVFVTKGDIVPSMDDKNNVRED